MINWDEQKKLMDTLLFALVSLYLLTIRMNSFYNSIRIENYLKLSKKTRKIIKQACRMNKSYIEMINFK